MIACEEFTTEELKQKLEMAKRSDAPFEIKKVYIETIENYLNKPTNLEVLQDIENSRADINDLLQ